MSSLQKFHRRTMSLGPVTWPATAIGGGDEAHGYWLGDASSNKLVVSPKSTETKITWGSGGTIRGTTSTSDGLTNTNTLAGFGQAAHPAAYYCKTLATGGYNTWYLPAQNELLTLYSNKSATPFATANSFVGDYYWSSTEYGSDIYGEDAASRGLSNGQLSIISKAGNKFVRAVRRSTI